MSNIWNIVKGFFKNSSEKVTVKSFYENWYNELPEFVKNKVRENYKQKELSHYGYYNHFYQNMVENVNEKDQVRMKNICKMMFYKWREVNVLPYPKTNNEYSTFSDVKFNTNIELECYRCTAFVLGKYRSSFYSVEITNMHMAYSIKNKKVNPTYRYFYSKVGFYINKKYKVLSLSNNIYHLINDVGNVIAINVNGIKK